MVFFAYFLFKRKVQLVLIRARVHPFPFRTRKLSSLLPTILAWRRAGKIGNANTKGSGLPDRTLIYSSLAQSVEPAAVNRVVVGSSPTGGAKNKRVSQDTLLFLVCVRRAQHSLTEGQHSFERSEEHSCP